MFTWRTLGVICLVALFGSRAAMAPAAAVSSPDPFPLGSGIGYRVQTTVLLNEPGGRGVNVGYRITARLNVAAVWSQDGDKLLKMELLHPKLHVKSRKAPSPEGFVEHSSRIDEAKNSAFYVAWKSGVVRHLYVDRDEPLAMVNIKRGLASLFQFQLLDGVHMELDVSGDCMVTYTSTGPQALRKSKKRCLSPERPFRKRPEPALSVDTQSKRETDYQFGKEGVVETVMADETHEMELVLKRDAGYNVRTKMELVMEDKKVKMAPMKAASIDEAVQQLQGVVTRTLRAEQEPTMCQEEQCPTMERLVKEYHSALTSEAVGGAKAATAFVRLLPAVRAATTDQILAVLDSEKNRDLTPQLCDLCGFAQTKQTHEAIKRFLDMDNEHDLDNWERYLWGLSMGAHPSPEVLADVLRILSKKANKSRDSKLSDTLLQTACAMARSLTKLPGRSYDDKLVQQVTTHVTQHLKSCQNNECRLTYLRAMRNLQDPSTIKILLQHASKSPKSLSVTAMKALREFPNRFLKYDTVQKTCRQIFFQLTKMYDSSARTLALDVLLDSGVSDDLLKDIVEYLRSSDKAFEVKQYVLQRLNHESDKDQKFAERVQNILRQSPRVYNYAVLGQKGFSTAFSREYAQSNWSSSSLATVQEMYGGMLKRGVVDFQILHEQNVHNIMSLGMFAGGLSSFVSSDSSEGAGPDQDEGEESATAGMEVSVHGVTIRPFVFFAGQGELMGHVWSGTGSDKTPAYQANSLLYDHQEMISLHTGGVAELKLVGGASIDLSGQVQISLWNRNAHSLVETNAGATVLGQLRVDNSFVRSLCEFSLTAEPKFHINSDINFYDKMALCMQPQQPEVIIKHNTFKVERIPGSKHRLRKSTYRTNKLPGKTHALNRKNSEMCNDIFR